MLIRWTSVIAIALLLVGLPFVRPAIAVEAPIAADTYTSATTPNANYGIADILHVRGPADVRHVFLRFDLGTLPANTTSADVVKAVLRLWVNRLEARGSFVVHEVTGPWSERTVAHGTAPTLGPAVATRAVTAVDSFITVDVTTSVQAWVDGSLPNRGFALLPGEAGIAARFDSKENDTSSHEPRLEIILAGLGDITGVTAGTGLTGGGTSGPVTLAISPTHRLPQACAAGQVPKVNASGRWVCATDGGGDVTAVTAGTGLTGGGNTGAVALAIAGSYSLPQACGVGQVAQFNGTAWICATDGGGDMTAVTTGTGLAGGGTTGAVELSILVPYSLPQACAANQVAKSNGTGVWSCAADANSGGTVTGVTASAPLTSTGGTAPTIGLPNVSFVSSNTAVGLSALASNTGTHNTASGGGALALNTSGSANTAHGSFALFRNTTGGDNTATGVNALLDNTTGSSNVAMGLDALRRNTLGTKNTGTGWMSLRDNTSGSKNTATGAGALVSTTTGSDNTASGVSALDAATTGSNNTAVGSFALGHVTTGSSNIAIGRDAGRNQTTGSDNIYIGSAAETGESNTMRLGAPEQTRTFVRGVAGVVLPSGTGVSVLINSQGQLGTTPSTRRVKEAILDMGAASQRLLQLRPVTFRYTQASANGSQPLQFGLIAEEVADVLPELVAYDKDGQPAAVQYHVLPALLLNELQRQQREMEILKAGMDTLRAELRALKAPSHAAEVGTHDRR